MLRLALVLTAVTACEKQAATPPPGELVDEGTLTTTLDGKVTARETFAIRKVADHLVLTASSETVEGAPLANKQQGELETDLAYRPIRMLYQYTSPKGDFKISLNGTPLQLDRIPTNGKPEKVTATQPIDVFVEGPGLIGTTALCKVDQVKTLTTISDFESGFKGKVVITSVGTAAKLKKLVVQFLTEFELEVYCDGDKLIGSGLRGNKLWNVREGREADFAAARDAITNPG